MWYSIHGALLPKSNKAVADASEALNWTYLLNFFFRVESSLELVLHLAVLGKKSNQPAFLEEKVIKYKVVSENYLPQRLSCLTVYYIMFFLLFFNLRLNEHLASYYPYAGSNFSLQLLWLPQTSTQNSPQFFIIEETWNNEPALLPRRRAYFPITGLSKR